MKYWTKISSFFKRQYTRLPEPLRLFLHRFRAPISFGLGLLSMILSYVLLFTLPNFVLLVNFTLFLIFVFLCLACFSVFLPIRNTKGWFRIFSITMAACSVLLCTYNFATVNARLGQIPIASVEDFATINRLDSANYILVNDIDCKGKSLPTIRHFTGNLNGGGYTIKNVELHNQSFFADNAGEIQGIRFEKVVLTSDGKTTALFAKNSGTLEDILVTDARIQVSNADFVGLIAQSSGELKSIKANGIGIEADNATSVGVIAGTCSGLESCCATGTITASGNQTMQIGGLCGALNDDAGAIRYSSCAVDISVNAKRGADIGELFGISSSKKAVSECYAQASVTLNGTSDNEICFGGLCGNAKRLYLDNCAFEGQIVFQGKCPLIAGGLLGRCSTAENISINNCCAGGSLTVLQGRAVAGGLIGSMNKVTGKTSDAVIKSSYTMMSVTNEDESELLYNRGVGRVDAESWSFISNCSAAKTLPKGETDQGLSSASVDDLLSKTYCVTQLGWNSKLWNFSSGLPILLNAVSVQQKEVENPVAEDVYKCKTIAVYPNKLYDAIVEKRIVCESTVNIRTGPATRYDRLTSLNNATKVSVVAEQDGWSLIQLDNGYGWLINDYLK